RSLALNYAPSEVLGHQHCREIGNSEENEGQTKEVRHCGLCGGSQRRSDDFSDFLGREEIQVPADGLEHGVKREGRFPCPDELRNPSPRSAGQASRLSHASKAHSYNSKLKTSSTKNVLLFTKAICPPMTVCM